MLRKRASVGDHDARVEAVNQYGDMVVVTLSWLDREERRQRWAQLLRVRGDRIVTVHDYAAPVAARAASRLFAAFA
jgi:hypothetical protein